MRVSALAATLAAASLSSARIVGIAAPSTIAPNSTYTLTLLTENYIQSVADIAVAWGFSTPPGFQYSLGSFVTSSYLGPTKSNTLKNVTIEASAPAGLENWQGKEVLLSAGVYSLYGVSSGPTVLNANVTINVGEKTSNDVVTSDEFYWGTAGEC